MNWFKKIAGQPRYQGQLQGDESRSSGDSLTERLDDNEVAEGKYVRILNRMYKEKKFEEAGKYIEELKRMGNSLKRVQSIMTRALHGVKL
jgi:hypothetical protein